MRYLRVQRSAMPYVMIHYLAIYCSPIRHTAAQHDQLQRSTAHYIAIRSHALQTGTIHNKPKQYARTCRHTATEPYRLTDTQTHSHAWTYSGRRCRRIAMQTRGRASACAEHARLYGISREFRDVVFEDVGFEDNTLLTLSS